MATPQEIEKTVLSARTDASRPTRSIQPELASLVGQRMAGCTIVDTIGSGAMGAVFRAIEHGVGNREVALKVLLPRWAAEPEFLARFHKEAASAGGLNNDHVVKVFRHGHERGLPYLVMELVEGGTLHGLAREGGVQPLEAVRLLRQACEGLYDAERHRLVHQDVKPANIMLAERRLGTGARERSRVDVKIVDFGVARATEASDSAQTHTFAGTVLYASPEQLACARLDHRSDMYSLGATFYEVLVGKAAARGTTLDEVTRWTLAAPRLSPRGERPEIPAELNTIIEKMTAQNPGDRYASFADVIDALTALEERWRSRDVFRRTIRWSVGIAAVAVVALAAFFWERDRRDAARRAHDAAHRDEIARVEVRDVLGSLAPPHGRLTEFEARLSACSAQLAACGIPLPELEEAVRRLQGDTRGVRATLQQVASDADLAAPDWPRLQQAATTARATLDALVPRIERVGLQTAQAEIVAGALRRIEADLASPTRDLSGLAMDLRHAMEDADREVTLTALLSEGRRLQQRVAELSRALADCAASLDGWERDFREARGPELRRLHDAIAAWSPPADLIELDIERRRRRLHGALQGAAACEDQLHGALTQDLDGDLASIATRLAAAWPRNDDDDLLNGWRRHRRTTAAEELASAVLAWSTAKTPGSDTRLEALDAYVARLDAMRRWVQTDPVLRLLAGQRDAVASSLHAAHERALAAAAALRATTPAIELPAAWPPELRAVWPADVAPPRDLRYSRSCRDGFLFTFGELDRVEMLLIRGDDPFLVDIRQVTHARFGRFLAAEVESGRKRGREYGIFIDGLGRARPDRAQLDASLVCRVHAEDALAYAAWTNKRLPSAAQMARVQLLLGAHDGPAFEAAWREADGRAVPTSRAWPGASDTCLQTGLAEITRDGTGFQVFGLTLYRPRDVTFGQREFDPRAYYARPDVTKALHPQTCNLWVGFRCVLPLRP